VSIRTQLQSPCVFLGPAGLVLHGGASCAATGAGRTVLPGCEQWARPCATCGVCCMPNSTAHHRPCCRVTEAVPPPPPAIMAKGDAALLAAMPTGATRRASSGAKGALAPSSFYCPISMELMSDPCMLATGHTYERVRAPAGRPLLLTASARLETHTWSCSVHLN
jgi:U-box domain